MRSYFHRGFVVSCSGSSELLGHTDPRIKMQHYIQRNETVNPATAEHLERVFGRAG